MTWSSTSQLPSGLMPVGSDQTYFTHKLPRFPTILAPQTPYPKSKIGHHNKLFAQIIWDRFFVGQSTQSSRRWNNQPTAWRISTRKKEKNWQNVQDMTFRRHWRASERVVLRWSAPNIHSWLLSVFIWHVWNKGISTCLWTPWHPLLHISEGCRGRFICRFWKMNLTSLD